MYQKESPIYMENNGIPLKDLMTTIVQNKYDNNFISESQYESVKNTLKSIFKAELVNKNIEDIKAEELQRFINTYKDYSDSSIKKIMGQFRKALQYTSHRSYITRNLITRVIRPKSNNATKVIRAMTL